MGQVEEPVPGVPAQNLPLAGKVAVVTGSSRGIGRATVFRLAAAGAKVIIHGSSHSSPVNEVVEAISQLGGDARVLLADFTAAEQRRTFAQRAWGLFGYVDICILCAGANILTGPARGLGFGEKLDLLWQVDVLGAVEVARMLGQQMKSRGHGVIVTLGWDAACRGMEGETAQAFAIAKGAVMAFTLALAQELAPQVRVNCIAPGWIRTGWAEKASQLWQTRASSESLLGRWGTPEEVAEVCLFLASPAASFVNGQIIPVNGGFNYRFLAKAPGVLD
ncbi:MAG: SDR family oxidoreductase [Thermoguttaceae bacterium]|nr:SDR family oxidoreductase [Thermoguttaceae bacterium]MDW8078086.1 SDR family oxidoreductase [Thermoguttaceae bacterium]